MNGRKGEKYKVDLVGGDTTSSLTGLTIGVTAVGSAEKARLVKRDGAKANDLICVIDGLASDLIHICKLSDTGCRIFYSKIPIDYETSKLAEEFNIDPIIPALNGGEDYELLFTIPLEAAEKIKLIQSVKLIGHMT